MTIRREMFSGEMFSGVRVLSAAHMRKAHHQGNLTWDGPSAFHAHEVPSTSAGAGRVDLQLLTVTSLSLASFFNL